MGSIYRSTSVKRDTAKTKKENVTKSKKTIQKVEAKTYNKLSNGQKKFYTGNRVSNAMAQQSYFNTKAPNPEYRANDMLKLNKDRFFTGGKAYWRVGQDVKDANGKKTGEYRRFTNDEIASKSGIKYVKTNKSSDVANVYGKKKKGYKMLSASESKEYARNLNKSRGLDIQNNSPIHKVNPVGTEVSPIKEGFKQANKISNPLGKAGAIAGGVMGGAFKGVTEIADVLNTLNYGAHGALSGFVEGFNNDGKLNKGELSTAFKSASKKGKKGLDAGISSDNEGRYGWYDTLKAFSDDKVERNARKGKFLSDTEEQKRLNKLVALGLVGDIGGALLTANAGKLATKADDLLMAGSKVSGNLTKGASKVAKVADLGVDLPVADLIRGTNKGFKYKPTKIDNETLNSAYNLASRELNANNIVPKGQHITDAIIDNARIQTNKARGVRDVTHGVKVGGFNVMSPKTVEKIADSGANIGGKALNTFLQSLNSKKITKGLSDEALEEVLNKNIATGLHKNMYKKRTTKTVPITPKPSKKLPEALQEVAMTKEGNNINDNLKAFQESLSKPGRRSKSKIDMKLNMLGDGSNVGRFTEKQIADSIKELQSKSTNSPLQLLSSDTQSRADKLKAELMSELGEDGFRQAKELTEAKDKLNAPKNIHKDVERITKNLDTSKYREVQTLKDLSDKKDFKIIDKFIDESGIRKQDKKTVADKVLAPYDRLTQEYKVGVTGLRPGWHVANFLQNKLNNSYGIGADAIMRNPDAKRIADAIMGDKQWLGKKVGKTVPTRWQLDETLTKHLDSKGNPLTQGQIADVLEMNDLIDNTFLKNMVKKQRAKDNNEKQNILSKIGDVVLPSGEHSMFSLGGLHNNVRTEQYDRVQQVLGQMNKGANISEGISKANKYLFDYDDVNKFEKDVMKRVMPFYTYFRKNVPLQLEQFANSPRQMSTYLDAKNQFEKGIKDEDKQRRDEYSADRLQIPGQTAHDEKGNMYNMMFNPSTPWDSLMELPTPNGEGNVNNLPAINPIIESMYRLSKNKDFFGNKIYGDENERGEDPRLTTPLDYFYKQVMQPSLGLVDDAKKLENVSVEQNIPLHILKALTGVNAKYYKSYKDWDIANEKEYKPTKKELEKKKHLVKKYK